MRTYSGCLSTKGLLIIIIIALVSATALGVTAYLFVPAIGINAVDNTAELLFGDVNWLSNVERNLAKNGYDADMTVNFPNELTGLIDDIYVDSNFSGYGSGDEEVADIDITFGTPDLNHTFGIFYDENIIAIEGIGSDNSDKNILFPRKNVIDALDNSVFHPESGSEHALDQENYDALCAIFEDGGESIDEEINEVFKSIRKRSAEHIDTETGFRFVEGEFALERRDVCTLDSEAIAEIIDITVEEICNNERVCAILEEAQIDITELGDKLKDEFRDAEITYTYVIKHGAISFVHMVIKTKNGEYDEVLDVTVDIESRKDGCFATVSCHSDVTTEEGRVEDNLEIKYNKKFEDSLTEISIDISLKNHDSDEHNSRTTVNYDKDSGEYIVEFITYIEDTESCVGIYGSFEKYEKHSGLSFTVDGFTDEGKNASDDDDTIFSLSLKENPDAKDITCPDGDNLLSMTAEEVKALNDNLPTEKLAEIYKEITGQYIPISEEGIMVMDPAALQIAGLMDTLYQNYRKNCTYYSYHFVPKIYIYLESSDVYLFASYSGGKVDVNYYYNPNNDLLKVYHPATIVNGELAVHTYVLVETKVADCSTGGYKKWECSLCHDEYISDRESALMHNIVWEKIDFTYDVGKTDYDAHYSFCSRCGEIQAIDYDQEYMDSNFSAYISFHTSSIVSPDSDMKHLIFPEELYKRYALQDLKLYNNGAPLLLSIRVPEGRQVIAKGDFDPATNLQVIALPNSIKEIEDGAFYTESNLHTIFYEGTEDEWKLVKLNGYETEWADVNVIFLPDGVDDLSIMQACIDTEKLGYQLDSKKDLTEDISVAENLSASNEKVELIYDGLVSLAAYDALTDTISVAEVGENRTVIRFLAPDGQVKSTVEISDVISIMDSDGGLLAMGSASLSIIYFYDIESGKLSFLEFKKYECTFDHLYVDGDRVIFVADCVDTTEEGLYSFVPGNECEKIDWLIGHEEIFFFRDNHTIITTDWVNNRILAYSTLNGTVRKSVYMVSVSKNDLLNRGYMYAYYTHGNGASSDDTYVYFDINMNETVSRPEPIWQKLTFDRSLEVQPIFASGNGRAALILDTEGDISVALASAGSDTTVIDYYAEEGFAFCNGDIVLYTPGGYGLILVNTK